MPHQSSTHTILNAIKPSKHARRGSAPAGLDWKKLIEIGAPKRAAHVRNFICFLINGRLVDAFQKIAPNYEIRINLQRYQMLVDNMGEDLQRKLEQLLGGNPEDKVEAARLIYYFLEMYNPVLLNITESIFQLLPKRNSYEKTQLARKTTIEMIHQFRNHDRDIQQTPPPGITKSGVDAQMELLATYFHRLFDTSLGYTLCSNMSIPKKQKEPYSKENQEKMTTSYLDMLKQLSQSTIDKLYRTMMEAPDKEVHFVTTLMRLAEPRAIEWIAANFVSIVAPGTPKQHLTQARIDFIGDIKRRIYKSYKPPIPLIEEAKEGDLRP